MDSRIRPGRTRQLDPLPEEDAQRIFYLGLHGMSILLDLKPAVIRPFIRYFKEISGHEAMLRAKDRSIGRLGEEITGAVVIANSGDDFGEKGWW